MLLGINARVLLVLLLLIFGAVFYVGARFAILTCTARYGLYIPVRQFTSTWTARYRANKKEEEKKEYRVILACASSPPAGGDRTSPRSGRKIKATSSMTRPRVVAAHKKRRNVSPLREKDRGD
ncbi:hypothetical protein B296_00028679, partial [Ensete ventricosum]